MTRSSYHKNLKGEYAVKPDSFDSATLRFIPCALWILDDKSGKLAEYTAALPTSWFSKCKQYARVPHGHWYELNAGNKQSSRPRTSKFTQGDNCWPQSDWWERDISRFYYDIQCKKHLHFRFQNETVLHFLNKNLKLSTAFKNDIKGKQ